MSTTTVQPLTGTVTVEVPIERAFQVFTESISSWWPNEYHIGAVEMAEPVLEPRAAGRWYERWRHRWSGAAGTRHLSPSLA